MTATHAEVMTKLAAFLAEHDDRPVMENFDDVTDELNELELRIGALPIPDRAYLYAPLDQLRSALAALRYKLEATSHAG